MVDRVGESGRVKQAQTYFLDRLLRASRGLRARRVDWALVFATQSQPRLAPPLQSIHVSAAHRIQAVLISYQLAELV